MVLEITADLMVAAVVVPRTDSCSRSPLADGTYNANIGNAEPLNLPITMLLHRHLRVVIQLSLLVVLTHISMLKVEVVVDQDIIVDL